MSPSTSTVSSCANCLGSFQNSTSATRSQFLIRISTSTGAKIKTEKGDTDSDSDSDSDSGRSEDGLKSVTILDALKIIFGITFPPTIETDHGLLDREELLVLCSKCTHYLSNLYSLYCGFKDLGHEDSYINTYKIEGGLKNEEDTETNSRLELIQKPVNIFKRLRTYTISYRNNSVDVMFGLFVCAACVYA
jgi:hypothetical protein